MATVPEHMRKSVQPYVREAALLDRRDAVSAYFLRLYALQEGIKVRDGDDECKQYLLTLMSQLESDKKKLPEEELDDHAALKRMTSLALRVFKIADDRERACDASKQTARAFMTASYLLDAVTQFSELNEDLLEKRKYARWKTAQILRALKTGEKVDPGPPGWTPAMEEQQRSEEERVLTRELDDLMAAPAPSPSSAPPPSSNAPAEEDDKSEEEEEEEEKTRDSFSLLDALPSVPTSISPALGQDRSGGDDGKGDDDVREQKPSAPPPTAPPPDDDVDTGGGGGGGGGGDAGEVERLRRECEKRRQECNNLRQLVAEQMAQLKQMVAEKRQLEEQVESASALAAKAVAAASEKRSASAVSAPSSSSTQMPTAPPSEDGMCQAQRHSKFVTSALTYDDYTTAVKECRIVLDLLMRSSQ